MNNMRTGLEFPGKLPLAGKIGWVGEHDNNGKLDTDKHVGVGTVDA